MLARLVALNEDALICDFAETYHIYDWRSLPATYAATLAAGLRPNSRCMMLLSDLDISMEQLLLASIADHCRLLVWQNTKDGHEGRYQPESILLQLMTQKEKVSSLDTGFSSVEDFNAWRDSMIGGGESA